MKIAIKNKKYFFACMAYCAMFVLCLVARLIFQYTDIDVGMPEEYSDLIWTVMSQIVAMLGIPLLIVFLGEKPNPKELAKEMGCRSTLKWWVYPVAVFIGFMLIAFASGVSLFTQLIILNMGGRWTVSASNPSNSVGLFFLALFTTAVLPAICEEGLHRGILVRGFRSHFKDGFLIFMIALLFALMHSNIAQTFYTFGGGLLMAAFAVKTRSIWPAIIIHFVNNAAATYQDYSTAHGWWLGDVSTNGQEWMSSNLGIAALLWLVCTAIAVVLTWVCIKYGTKRELLDDIEAEEGYEYPSYATPDGVPVVRFNPLNGKALYKKQKPILRLVGEEKTWVWLAVILGIVYTVMTLIWRLI